jgi:hypothetical protein
VTTPTCQGHFDPVELAPALARSSWASIPCRQPVIAYIGLWNPALGPLVTPVAVCAEHASDVKRFLYAQGKRTVLHVAYTDMTTGTQRLSAVETN